MSETTTEDTESGARSEAPSEEPDAGKIAPRGEPSTDALDALWGAIRSAWSEEKRHQAFLAYCQEHDRLAEAALRYRSVGTDPGATDEERRLAEQKLKSITVLALAKLSSEKASPTGAGMKYVRLAAALMLAAALLLLGWALAR